MNAVPFLTLVNAWPEAVLLVGADGVILGGSPSIERQIGLPSTALCGKSLEDVADFSGDILEYLRACARSRQPIPGSLAFGTPGGPNIHCRVHGAVLCPRTDEQPALIFLRLTSKETEVHQFLALNEKIEELTKEIHRRERVQAQLESALQTKEVLLREVHHRVKNNLQVISSLLDLHLVDADNPREWQVLREIRNRIQVIALVHQRLYGGENLEKIDLGAFLRDLTAELFKVYKGPHQNIGVDLDFQTEQIYVNLDTATNCGLLTHELISNSLKHAFPGGRRGTIQVALNNPQAPGTILLQVSDDGIGMPEDVELLKPHTLGMELVHSLVRQIGGSVSIAMDRGTTFVITFAG
jgi:two-component sensor histidine kinase